MHLAEDLALLRLGRLFEQVSDLGGLQPPDPAEGTAQQRAARVPDQRLEVRPVLEGMRGGLLSGQQAQESA